MRIRDFMIGILFIGFLVGCSSKLDEVSQDYAPSISVIAMIEQFNQQVSNQKDLKAIELDEMRIIDEIYWFPLYQDIMIYMLPVTYTGDIEKDIVWEMGLQIEKSGSNELLGEKYLNHLLLANDKSLTQEQMSNTIKKAILFDEEEHNITFESCVCEFVNKLCVSRSTGVMSDNKKATVYTVFRDVEVSKIQNTNIENQLKPAF